MLVCISHYCTSRLFHFQAVRLYFAKLERCSESVAGGMPLAARFLAFLFIPAVPLPLLTLFALYSFVDRIVLRLRPSLKPYTAETLGRAQPQALPPRPQLPAP